MAADLEIGSDSKDSATDLETMARSSAYQEPFYDVRECKFLKNALDAGLEWSQQSNLFEVPIFFWLMVQTVVDCRKCLLRAKTKNTVCKDFELGRSFQLRGKKKTQSIFFFP